MGKKPASSKSSSSRGNKANKDRKSSSSNNNGDTVDEAITPENGWIVEKDEAVKAVKCERNKQNIFRLARAYHKLRQWKKLENITSLTAINETFPIISNKSSVDNDDNNNDSTNTNTYSRSSNFYRKQLSAWKTQY